MATARSSPSPISYDHTSSPPHDQTSLSRRGRAAPGFSVVLSAAPRTPNRAKEQCCTEMDPLHNQPLLLQLDEPSVVRRLLLDSWVCEAFAMSFSVGCLVAIVFVVGAYDGEKIPQLVSGLTLNAIISLLSTASRTSLIFVVGAIMGQLKWCWLKRSERQIYDIQSMDDASRGPLGALSVLASWTGGSLVAMGSTVTLLMIAFSPFLQQLVDYPSRNTTQPGAFALAPHNLAYTHHTNVTDQYSLESESPWEENVELFNVLEAGIWTIPKPFDKEPTCSTGQCSWPKFQSVGWCRQNRWKLYLGDNLVMSYGNSGADLSNFQAPELSSGTTRLLDLLNPLVVIGNAIVELDSNGRPDGDLNFDVLQVVQTNQCMLNPCEKTLSLNTINGTSTWNVESTNYGNLIARNVSLPMREWTRYTPDGITTLCWQAEEGDLNLSNTDESSYVVDRSKRAFCPVEDYAYNIQKYLQGRFIERFAVNLYELDPAPFGFRSKKDFYEFRSGRFSTVGPDSTRNLSQRVESIADALTNYGLQTTNDTVLGVAIAEESYVRVRWPWIILPAFLEVATLALLVLTIIHSRREGVTLWKSSVLVLVYHGVDELRGQETLANESLSGMEITAKTTNVQLVKSEAGLSSLSKRSGYQQLAQDR